VEQIGLNKRKKKMSACESGIEEIRLVADKAFDQLTSELEKFDPSSWTGVPSEELIDKLEAIVASFDCFVENYDTLRIGTDTMTNYDQKWSILHDYLAQATVKLGILKAPPPSSDDGLSGGAIAGIVIGVVAFIALVVGAGVWANKRKNS
jgi:hypothetical protein